MQVRELTLRGLVLGALITTVFTAANVYLGLKVGLTFASSIPAAVISMALLSLVRNSSILENNIVQTVASAAGTLSAIIFVMPGLVIVGWWTGFPFWQSFLICVSGGVLGVLFTVPLRRALVTNSDLPYPEGVAAAEVLKVGSEQRSETRADPREAHEGLIAIILGSAASAGLSIVSATQLVATEIAGYFRVTATAASGYSIAWSLALFGAGHLVGLAVGLAMLMGLLIAWAAAVPILTSLQPAPEGIDFAKHAANIWRHQVRFIGAGAIGVSAIWTLAKLAKPVVSGLVSSLSSSRRSAAGDDRDRDLSPRSIVMLTFVCLAVTGALSFTFARSTTLAPHAVMLAAIAVPFVFVVGFLIAGVCGYMAGLIGASNSPISGVGILAIVICASILASVVPDTADSRLPLVAFALFVTAIVFACATISNDNLQDLKTGQLVGASPRRQQIALIVGVAAGAGVIPPVLNLLARAYGFAGAPNVAVVSQNPLPAPQATLISALAQGVIGGNLDWKMIGIGALVGVGLILLDAALKLTKRMSLPPLAVGIGIYLPMSATFAVVLGAVVGHWYNRRARQCPSRDRAERLGTLVASGLIVGESLFGVLNAGLIVAFSKDAPLALVPATFAPAKLLGALVFVGLVVWLYGWMLSKTRSQTNV
ncbi:MAG TPA: oligopeptide transporter, OPT family [Candidatus Nitrosotalea sp.]|nr:oligopeptide transporter, OPT family [Candidatus Nitrosotalea sp.]